MDSSETNLIEFCAVYGGIGIGLGRVIEKLRTIALCEIEGFAIENLIAKMEAGRIDQAPVWNDLKTFPSKQFHGMVDILSAGFPCQPFSCAGLRRADDDPRHLFPYIMQSVESIRPRFVFLENVEGLISAKLGSDCWADPIGTPVLLHVCRELERRGYTPTWGVFSASETGAPHQRKRVFILAYNVSEGLQGDFSRLSGETRREEPCGSVGGCGGSSRQGSMACCDGSRQQQGHQEVEGKCTKQPYRNSIQPWPSRPGEPQYWWEPPRVVGDTKQQRLEGQRDYIAGLNRENEGIQFRTTNGNNQYPRQVESTLGGDADGTANRMDYAELCESCDNRVDELRLLGNGVVPATAAKAWQVLYERLMGVR